MDVKHILIIILSLFSGLISAQAVSDVRWEQAGKSVNIFYNLSGEGSYEVKVFYSLDGGRSWDGPLQTVTGNAGKGQSAGKALKITWDVLAERDVLQGNLKFRVTAAPEFKTYESCFLPVFIPGTRLKHYPRSISWGAVRAVTFWGAAGASIAFKLSSDKQYDLYHQATTQDQMDKYYEKANNYYLYYQWALWTGITVWAFDMLRYGLLGFNYDRIPVKLGYDPRNDALCLTYTYKF